ncbi:unnamed protein product [Medioppia subpectinata]|uniref:G-protein coupled receptors family 1 profile domain-containing protein n=1 Tax=Medioppia subpectinata TaxID=1979941 RepID=A0A7R9PXT0_9ACAR|nr:unnamed protein product [Medioppia subpectinata]CAG2104342.1 unnamed protein product [Medioppia subpectinata]
MISEKTNFNNENTLYKASLAEPILRRYNCVNAVNVRLLTKITVADITQQMSAHFALDLHFDANPNRVGDVVVVTCLILDVWVFGEIWCKGWLVIDVWMCTASILNLCAISIDRYLAVTRPVRYRSIMTSKRAKIFIACVWVLSFIICFPPLVGWNDKKTPLIQSNNRLDVDSTSHLLSLTTHSYPTTLSKQSEQTFTSVPSLHEVFNTSSVGIISSTSPSIDTLSQNDNHLMNSLSDFINKTDDESAYNARDCQPSRGKCDLFQDKGYVIYSALGSFFIPMFVMVFFYWRIYLVASRTSRALARGYKTTKCNGSHDERLTLRIHRGYGDDVQSAAATNTSTYLSTHNESNTLNTTNFSGAGGGHKSRSFRHNNTHESQASDQNQSTSASKSSSRRGGAHSKDQLKPTTITVTPNSGATGATTSGGGKKQMPITLYRSSRLTASLSPNNCEQNGQNRRMSPSNQSTLSIPSSSSPCSSREGSARSGKLVMTRFSKRTSKYQAKRFHAETKAAKTVGIIVGGFILCWLPFFTVYLARAFCVSNDCIPDLLLSIFVWLGYCNSMINPCIYGLFSKDFRRAFRNILCKCKFREETVSSLIRQIHMPTFFEDMPEDMVKTESQED